jgi:hypothetical protein
VTWTPDTSASSYIVSYGTDEAASNLGTTAETTTSLSLSGLTLNTKYYYKVATVSSTYGRSDWSTAESFTTLAGIIPAAPAGCAVSTVTAVSMTVSWTDDLVDQTAFHIDRSDDSINYTEIGTVDANTKAYSGSGTTGLLPDNEYWFRVRAENDGAYSGYAVSAGKYTLAVPVSPESFGQITSSVVNVKWSNAANANTPEAYCENITNGANSGWIAGATWPSADLSPEAFYSFRVKAKNGDGIETGWTSLGSAETGNVTNINTITANTGSIINGDVISTNPKLQFEVKSPDVDVDISTCRIYIDNVVVTDGDAPGGYYDTFSGTLKDGFFSYRVKKALSIGNHAIKMEVKDKEGTIYTQSVSGLKVVGGAAEIADVPLCSPNPFDPLKGTAKMSYSLTEDTGVALYIFDMTGKQVIKKVYPSGTEGAHAGYNQVEWDGKTVSGSFVENDAYFVRIVKVSENKVIGKLKIMVMKAGM